MQSTAAAAAGLGLARSLPSCAEPDDDRLRTVAVIGGGLAGLHCGYRLWQAKVTFHVFEASERVGGRMFTARDMFPDKQVAELGGELVDSNHRFMLALAEELELTLDDRLPPEGYVVDTWFVGGVQVPEATIVEQFTAVAPALAHVMTQADDDEEKFAAFDNTRLSDFLDEYVPQASYAELHAVLTSAYRGEFGLECEQQSALNLVYLIGSDDPDPFRIFGESDERYHVHGGSDLLTSALADKICEHVSTGQKLVAIEKLSGRYRLTLRNGDGVEEQLDFGRVVFALPFTLLRELDLSELGLSEEKRDMIQSLGYGTNAKVMGAFTERVWFTQHSASGSATTDLPLQQCWDSAIGQAGASGILTNFLGGEQGEASSEGSAEERFTAILPDLETVYPGVTSAYLPGSAVRMHWPSYKYTRGSYACYRPGQWSYWTLEGKREGHLHFCGEHTSPEFQGWMEGAAETGGRVAKEICDDWGKQLPAILTELLDDDALLVGSESESRRLPFFPRRAAFLAARVQGSIQGKKR
jgi:monoamine oxidase